MDGHEEQTRERAVETHLAADAEKPCEARQATAVALLVAATTLWGCFSAGLALLGSRHAGPLVSLGAAIPLLAIAAAAGRRPDQELRTHKKLYLRLGALEAVNISLYVAALALGPAPVVVALHLASPLLLVARAVLTGVRTVSTRLVVEGMLLVGAIAIVAARPGTGTVTGTALVGCVLALGSAGAVTALIVLVARQSRHRDPAMSAGLQLAIAALVTTPLLTISAWDWRHAVAEVALGSVTLGPGFFLYWRAMKHLSPSTAGVLGLNEAVVAAAVVGVVDRSQISLPTILAGTLVAAAVVLDTEGLRRLRGGGGTGGGR
ncbi:DMT family transporter [Nocardia asiatica]|uniref:DMT family transporter n=1 Tax=Nocardia asiatica TaxID=209252 RepID=UPI0005C26478|nr:DMT family transporter [Nocardia asiatica]